MGREAGSGWGTHVNPWQIHVNVWQKPLQYCKVISLQIIKIIGGEKKRVGTVRKGASDSAGSTHALAPLGGHLCPSSTASEQNTTVFYERNSGP